MKYNGLLKTILIAGALVAAFSCKKEEKKETLPSLDGYVSFDVPKYVLQGESISFTPSGVTHPKGGDLIYYVTVSKDGREIARDTVKHYGETSIKEFTYKFHEDSLGSYNISGIAYAEGYNTNMVSSFVNEVGGLTRLEAVNINGETVMQIRKNPHASVTESGIDVNYGKYFDTDTERYFYTEATEGLYWMQNNLQGNGGQAYEGAEAMSGIFGRYYTYNDAMKACPEGWRLPTAAEWDALITRTADEIKAVPSSAQTVPGAWIPDAKFNGREMWEYWPANDKGIGNLTNSMKMCVLPAGYANLASMKFDGVFEYAMFWSSDLNPANASQAKVYQLYNYWNDVRTAMVDKTSFGASVRCVREKIK